MLNQRYLRQIQSNLNQIDFDNYESNHLLDQSELRPIICFMLVTLYTKQIHNLCYLIDFNSHTEHAIHVLHQLHLIHAYGAHETKLWHNVSIQHIKCALTDFGIQYTKFLFKNPVRLYKKQIKSKWIRTVIPSIIISLIFFSIGMYLIINYSSLVLTFESGVASSAPIVLLLLKAMTSWYIGSRKIFSGKHLSKCDFLKLYRNQQLYRTVDTDYLKYVCDRCLFNHPHYHMSSAVIRHDRTLAVRNIVLLFFAMICTYVLCLKV